MPNVNNRTRKLTKADRQRCLAVIDDFQDASLVSNYGTTWRAVTDSVMGGVSQATITSENLDGYTYLRLSGEVQLDNNGGFVQAILDFDSTGALFDASKFAGLRMTVRGNGEVYGLHLRTADTIRSWQSYRTQFTARGDWQTIDLPFDGFTPHRLDLPLDVRRMRRLGLVAIGRAFYADLSVSNITLYR